jgi:hypothetical protein
MTRACSVETTPAAIPAATRAHRVSMGAVLVGDVLRRRQHPQLQLGQLAFGLSQLKQRGALVVEAHVDRLHVDDL